LIRRMCKQEKVKNRGECPVKKRMITSMVLLALILGGCTSPEHTTSLVQNTAINQASQDDSSSNTEVDTGTAASINTPNQLSDKKMKSKGFTKINQTINDPNVGLVTLKKETDVFKKYTYGNFTIYIKDLLLLNVSHMKDDFRKLVNATGEEYSYLQVRYDVTNDSKISTSFNGIVTAVLNNQKQISISNYDIYHMNSNPLQENIKAQATIKNNFFAIPVNLHLKSIRFVPGDYDDADDAKSIEVTIK
jgi:hypothetical protein